MSTPPARATADFAALQTLTFRLTYADTDPAGLLYFATWFPWMERTQAEWMFAQGLRHDTLLERFGFALVTRHTQGEYLVPVGLFDEIRDELRLGRVGRASFTFEHRMFRTSDEALAGRGSVTLVTVGASGAPVSIPPPLRSCLDAWSRGQALGQDL